MSQSDSLESILNDALQLLDQYDKDNWLMVFSGPRPIEQRADKIVDLFKRRDRLKNGSDHEVVSSRAARSA